jgi:protein arginine N-methyltransferase 1
VVLRRVAPLTITLDSSNEVVVRLPGGDDVAIGSRGLVVLDAFSVPRTLADALDDLRERLSGIQDFVDLTGTLAALVRAGVLVTEDAPAQQEQGWADPAVHVAMLDDRERTAAYLEAIGRVVRPGDVVLDLGTGSGVLAVAAARAGARRVYAVEASGVGRLARAVFEANGVADRVTLVPGWSTQVSLPEPADVLVSETIGNEPLGERMLEAVLDARRRLLAPGARLVPRALRLRAAPVSLPDGVRRRWGTDAAAADDWRAWYGVDLAPLLGGDGDGAPRLRTVRADEAAGWTALGEPREVAGLDLGTMTSLVVDGAGTCRATSDGRVDAVVVSWVVILDDEGAIRPGEGGASHWATPVWVLPRGLEVRAGDEMTLTYRYRVPGHPDGAAVERA